MENLPEGGIILAIIALLTTIFKGKGIYNSFNNWLKARSDRKIYKESLAKEGNDRVHQLLQHTIDERDRTIEKQSGIISEQMSRIIHLEKKKVALEKLVIKNEVKNTKKNKKK